MDSSRKQHIPKQTLLHILPGFKGRKYEWGGNGKIIGDPFDCFGMLVEYTKLRNTFDILELHSDSDYDFDGYTGYEETFAMEMFHSYLNEYFIRVVPSYKMAGDIISCRVDSRRTIGIYLGKKKMLITSPKTNCIIIPTEHYDIRNAYRWPLLSRSQHK